mmetsp:Transcript_69684/g.145605  ORF Transcript_69684/g.145605 Transcript_69684/m.145605 type:complete len:83 (-) Transcript_69684:14-262(-)
MTFCVFLVGNSPKAAGRVEGATHLVDDPIPLHDAIHEQHPKQSRNDQALADLLQSDIAIRSVHFAMENPTHTKCESSNSKEC